MMSACKAAVAIQGDLLGEDAYFTGVSTDTRTVGPGDLFIALIGKDSMHMILSPRRKIKVRWPPWYARNLRQGRVMLEFL